jgi:predicted PurR-regulated permease PerM
MNMISLMRNRILAAFVTFHMVLLVTSPALAGLIPSLGSSTQATGYTVQQDIDSIQQALETKIVKEKLKAYGFSSEEAAAKLSSMNPHQIHLLAVASPDVLAGGTSTTAIFIVIIIAASLYVLWDNILWT